ncbi:unnamed protein product [Larinioides sclopetarius]|uniref:Sushi domain-containing protein n=1 Tax=Larinioides sclopetarius TaxID=280406 RepID=A0AAV1ZE99_9ARAC
MAVFSLLSVYRLLGIAVLVYLQCFYEVCARDHHNKDSSNITLDEFHRQQSDSHHSSHSRKSGRMGRIETSIIPIVNSKGSGHDKESSPGTLAEVRVLIPKGSSPLRKSLIRPPDPHEEGLIRASSILMEYDEDTRKYIQPNARTPIPEHRIRHSSHKHTPEPLLDDYFAANDAPLDEVDSSPISSSSTEDQQSKPSNELSSSNSRDNPARILLRVNSFSSAPRRLYPFSKAQREEAIGNTIPKTIASSRTFKPLGQDSVIAFHSPVRIYIPVRYDAENSSSPTQDADDNCVQCPQNITLTAPRGETRAETPVPAISVCHRLARRRRPINVATTAGPRPGTRIPGGSYPVELAVWVADQHVHSCHYTLDVIVQKCKDVFPPIDGSVHCSHGTIYGSKCNFSCSSGYELLGHHSIICEEHPNGMSWSSSFPKCKKIAYKYSPSVKSLPCLKPQQPSDGTVVCDSNGQSMYSDGSVCQFFCYPGFLIENLLTSNALIVCKNGQWTPNSNVQCIATYCSDPRKPEYGSVRCNNKDIKEASFKSKYRNGTSCNFQCDTGYVIPKSQRHLNKITCHAPHWNDSSIPECKQKFVPRPYSRDCKDIILTANRRGFAKLKPPRFFMKSSSSNNILYGNCTYSGRINVGAYINHCSAHNGELNTTGNCTFRITVKENSCSPPPIVPHSKLHCDYGGTHSFPRGSVCEYICNKGFVMPLRQRKFQSRKCTSKLQWKPAAVPLCKRSVPPKPRKGSCISQTILAKDGSSAKIKLPKFKSSMKGNKIKVKCSLNGTLPVGHYTNHCDAVDRQLGLSSSCTYNITIEGSGCPELPVTSSLLANCSNSKIADNFPLGTICSYTCEDEYVIPTSSLQDSVKICIAHEEWNNSLIPTCNYQSSPVAVDDSCINRSTVIEDISTFQIPIPKFKSSSGEVEVNCEPQNITEYGIYSINCTAFDPELRTQSQCIFEMEILKVNEITEPSSKEISGCPQLPIIPSASLACTEAKSGELFPIGTVCSYNCDDGYVFPTSTLKHAEKYCIDHDGWESTVTPVCTNLVPPMAETGSCLDYSATVEDLSTFQYNVPQFIAANGATIKAECKPETIPEYGEQNISCSAYDPELRVNGSCSFTLDVQIPNNVAALSAEEISCSYPEKIENGDMHCNSTISKLYSAGTICKVICNDGFTLPTSQLNMSVSVCLPNGEWNVSSNPFCLKFEPPVLVSGCENLTLYTSDLPLVNIELPIFYTSQNTSVYASCFPETFEKYGEYEISCIAHDLELDISTKCTFYLELMKNQSEITTKEYSEIFSTTEQPSYEVCKPIEPPHKGSVNCSYEPPAYCNISCDDGYEFSSDHQLLNSGKLECDGTDGLWIYEKAYGSHLLPECLGRLQNTFVEVEVTFRGYVERCDEIYESQLQISIQGLLVDMNQQMCQSVNCTFFNVSCFMDSSSKRFKIDNIWILKAAYDPSEYVNSDAVPDAETNIETIMDVVQKETNSKNSKFKEDLLQLGVELLPDTNPNLYHQSHFFLVCEKDGYAVDLKTNKCVECPSGTMEKNGTCVPCPEGYFQLSTGQSSCEVCPEPSFFTSDIPKTCSV